MSGSGHVTAATRFLSSRRAVGQEACSPTATVVCLGVGDEGLGMVERTPPLWDGAKVVWVGPPRPDDGLDVGGRVVVAYARGHPSLFTSLTGRGHRRRVVIATPDGRQHLVRRGELSVVAPDHPLKPESDGSLADWWLDQLEPWGDDLLPVGAFVPASLPAVACVLHPWVGDTADVAWAAVADEFPSTTWAELLDEACDEGRDSESRHVPMHRYSPPTVGHMPTELARRLVDVLGDETTTPHDVVVAVWTGWGDVPIEQFPGTAVIPTPFRDHFLLRGPITGVLESVSAAGFVDEVEAGTWWPTDRAWLACTEVDFPWTFVAADDATITRLMEDPGLETVRVSHETPADHPGP